MHRAFKLDSVKFPEGSYETGVALSKALDTEVRKCLEAFVSEGEINGSLLRDHWFPEISADIFISHSHADEKLALSLSGWLKNQFGISCFIDSAVWGHSDELLKIIDNHNCWQEKSRTYNYKRRNGTTSHVHMMLSTALSRMIDVSECVIFVSTPNSVSTSENLDSQVSSPWIFYELSQMEVIRKRPVSDYRMVKKAERHDFSAKEESDEKRVKINYRVDFDSLTNIQLTDLNRWDEEYKNDKERHDHPLDFLYEALPLKSLILEG